MADKSSWVKIDRNIIKWRWYQNANTVRLFFHLILSANYEDHDFEKITVHRGEVATSIASLSKQLKITPRSIRTALEHLKSTGEVTSTAYSKFQVISIEKYDQYQAVLTSEQADSWQATDKQVSGNGQATDRQLAGKCQQSKNIRNKERKKGKNNSSGDETTTMIPMPPTVADVRAYCAENGITTDAEAFVKFNTVRGWMYGRVKITDWRPLVHQWAAKDNSFADQSNPNYDPHPELDDFGRPIQPKYK